MEKQAARRRKAKRPGPAGSSTRPVPIRRPAPHVTLLVVFVLALTVRLAHLWQLGVSDFGELLLGDSAGYDRWARRIAEGDWLGTEVFYQAPLYPYVLGLIYAVFGPDVTVVRVCQAILGAGSCVLLAVAGSRIFSPRVGAVAGVMLALYAPAIFVDATLQKSVLDLLLV